MFPLRDDIPSEIRPWVNYFMMAVCTIVFLLQVGGGDESTMVERLGMVPARVSGEDTILVRYHERGLSPGGRPVIYERQRPMEEPALPAILTLLSCIFLHGGWMHFLGNMWFLYIFGDNIEDRLGHWGYAGFYLACGVAASLAHFLAGPDSTIPTIGASGAIAGVMGAYMYLYPRARVLTVIPFGYFLHTVNLPAIIFLGIWFVIQMFSGVVSMGASGGGGVAWWAHIGGFVVGLAVVFLLGRLKPQRARVEHIDEGARWRDEDRRGGRDRW